MHWLLKIFISITALGLLAGCTSEARKRLEPTPRAIGSLNQLAVIADQDVWDGAVGDSISFYFASAYPILTQPEPLFDLKHFTPEHLAAESLRKELKAYLIVGDLNDQGSPTTDIIMEDLGTERINRAHEDPSYRTSVGRNRWAQGQVAIYLFALGEEALGSEVAKRFPSIAGVVQEQYREQINATAYQAKSNAQVNDKIAELIGCRLDIPGDYRINLEKEKTLWLMKESDMATFNFLIDRRPYESQKQFEKENIIALRDELGKLVSSSAVGSYMRTNPVDLPVYTKKIDLGGAYAVEARGIWEMEGDFAGGPFISYLILDEGTNEIIFIDAFLLAPGERKRNLMLYMEHIVHSSFQLSL